jgi:(5-formylfuran-3-yl)methyl phosphate synthase
MEMQLLISPRDLDEAAECANAAPYLDIVDVKNPKEGSLGANFPWVIRAIRDRIPSGTQVSATVGDAPYKPGTVALAALGAVVSGATYIKVGLYGCSTTAQAIEVMTGAVRAVRDHDPHAKVVAAGYADAQKIGCVNPLAIPYIAHEAGCDVAMVDTAMKGSTDLFDHMPYEVCADFIRSSHELGVEVALAGSLTTRHLPDLARLGPDIIGIRGAVCEGGDRNQGRISSRLIQEFRTAMNDAEAAAKEPVLVS